MTVVQKTAAITGAYGYLGGVLRTALDALGWRTIALVRRPAPGDADARPYDLARPVAPETLVDVDVLIHCAYDLTLTNHDDIARVNIAGSQRLLEEAARLDVDIVVLSSMSAYQGTTQLYGHAKLQIEATTVGLGGCAIRPGLVHGPGAGGMAAALGKMTRLPVIPIPAGENRQFTVHQDDLAAAVIAVIDAGVPAGEALSAAHAESIPFRQLLTAFADGRECRFLPVPWAPMYGALRAAELARLKLPFRADSLLGLVRGAPGVVGTERWNALGVEFRPLTGATAPRVRATA